MIHRVSTALMSVSSQSLLHTCMSNNVLVFLSLKFDSQLLGGSLVRNITTYSKLEESMKKMLLFSFVHISYLIVKVFLVLYIIQIYMYFVAQ